MKYTKHILLIITLIICSTRYAAAQAPTNLQEVFSASTEEFANYLEFSKDGNFLVLVVGSNANVYQKKDNAFKLMQTLSGERSQAIFCGISDDGTYIAFSTFGKTFIYKREKDIYKLQQTIIASDPTTWPDLMMHFTRNNKLMIVGIKGNIRFYELNQSSFIEVNQVATASGLDFDVVALSPNGHILASMDSDGSVRCWEIAGNQAYPGNIVLKVEEYRPGIIDITNDGLLVAGTKDSISIYQLSGDLSSAAPIHRFPDDKLSRAKFNQEGNKLILTDEEGLLSMYKIDGQSVSSEYKKETGVLSFNDVEMTTGGQWLAASSQGKQVIKIYKDLSWSPALISTTGALKKFVVKKQAPVIAKGTAGKKAAVKKNTPAAKSTAVKDKPLDVKKYPEYIVTKVGDYTIFEAGKKYGVKGGMLNNVHYLEAIYDTVIGLRMEEDHKYKTRFVVIDKNGLQVFDPDKSSFINTTEKLTEYMYSSEYLLVKTGKGRWNFYNESISSTSGYANVQLLYNSFVMFTAPNKIKVAAWDKIHGYFGESYDVPEGAEIIHFGGPGEFLYKSKNKTGYTNAKRLIYLPPLFDDIKLSFGTKLQLKYGAEIYSTSLDDIRLPRFSSTYIIKAMTFGKSCGRSDCRNGIIGMTTETTGGKVEKRQYDKLTINGWITVTSTYVTPVKTTTSAINCPDRIHDSKRFVLQVDQEAVVVNKL